MHINIYISLVIALILIFINYSAAFQISSNQNRIFKLSARRQRAEVVETVVEPKYEVGKDLPEEIINLIPIYDMILVERFNAPERTSAGILLPKIEGKDKKQTAKVIAIGKNYGLESEQGRLQSLDEIVSCKVGDIVFIRDPWGIGPKEIQVNERCFSFHKAVHILAVVQSNRSD